MRIRLITHQAFIFQHNLIKKESVSICTPSLFILLNCHGKDYLKSNQRRRLSPSSPDLILIVDG